MILNHEALQLPHPIEWDSNSLVEYVVDESYQCFRGVLLAHEAAFWIWLQESSRFPQCHLGIPEDRYFPCSERSVDFFGQMHLEES